MSDNEKKTSFKVRDRRISEDENETPASSDEAIPPEQELKEKEPKGKKESKKTTQKKVEKGKQDSAQFSEINFATFILSMSSSAMLHMGEVPYPETGKTEKNLLLAKQSIDIIEMLKEKTKGNLTSDEKTLIDNVLYDLRMRYVKGA